MSCERASQLISKSMDCPLTRRERLSLRIHLVLCGACRALRRQLQAIRLAARRSEQALEQAAQSAGEVLSAESRERIAQTLRRGG